MGGGGGKTRVKGIHRMESRRKARESGSIGQTLLEKGGQMGKKNNWYEEGEG